MVLTQLGTEGAVMRDRSGKAEIVTTRSFSGYLALVWLFLAVGCGAPQLPKLMSLVIDPGTSSLPLGRNLQLKAIGLFSDGSRRDMTTDCVWDSSEPDVAQIDSFGMARSITIGTVSYTHLRAHETD